jgi:hypothetical protein
MSEYISTNGRTRIAIGICGRCSLKFALDDLSPDINYPGLLVCGNPGTVNGKGLWSGGSGCSDAIDPYRLPPHETEDITLDMPRPDTKFPLPGYVTVAPGDPNWPTNTFLGGQGAVQQPPAGNTN